MLIKIEVKTGAPSEKVEILEENHFKIFVRAQKEKGKANLAILKLLKKHFGKPVRIVSGFKSSTKIIEVLDD